MSVRRLPLFPLPLVLFPGSPLPLHIFEPRYREMVRDCLAGDRSFGVIYRPEETEERSIPPGAVGCLAAIDATEELPDGRSNIIVHGVERFALERFVDGGTPYHVGAIVPYQDDPEDASSLAAPAEALREVFDRIARAARALADDRERPPALPEDPSRLSFAVASMLDLDAPARQRLLASRSALARIRELHDLLASRVRSFEGRADVHRRAKLNGDGPAATA